MNNRLQLTIGDIRRETGRYLGFDRDPTNWTADETQDVWDVIDSGMRQFARPPVLPGETKAHQWSFLRPQGTMHIKNDIDDYTMPEDFGGLDGDIYFVREDWAATPIQIVNEGRILSLRMRHWYNTTQYYPQFAALTPNVEDGLFIQTYKLQIWPKPDQDYEVRFTYFRRMEGFRSDYSVPPGGPEHAETLRASIMAAAESHLDDEVGQKHGRYMTLLQGSVSFDRVATSPQNLGYNDDHSGRNTEAGYVRSSRLTAYEKFPI